MKAFRIFVLIAAAVLSAALAFGQDAPPPPPVDRAPEDYRPPDHGEELIPARFLPLGAPAAVLARNAQFVQQEVAKQPEELPVKRLPDPIPPPKVQPEVAKEPAPLVIEKHFYHAGPPIERETAAPASVAPSKVRHPNAIRRSAARVGQGLVNWGNRTWIALDQPNYAVTVSPAKATYTVNSPAPAQAERSPLPSPQAPTK